MGRSRRSAAGESGVAYDTNGRTKAGMGVAGSGSRCQGGTIAIVVTNLTREGATLFRRRQRPDRGCHVPIWPVDAHVRLHRVRDAVARLRQRRSAGSLRRQRRDHHRRTTTWNTVPVPTANLLFHDESTTQKFRDASDIAGDAFQRLEVGRGAAVGDIDNDGAVDIPVTNNNGPVRRLHNIGSQQHWLEVRLEGVRTIASALGRGSAFEGR